MTKTNATHPAIRSMCADIVRHANEVAFNARIEALEIEIVRLSKPVTVEAIEDTDADETAEWLPADYAADFTAEEIAFFRAPVRG